VSISAETTTHESVAAAHVAAEPSPEEAVQLEQLYRDFEQENLIPLWTEIGDLMPMVPSPKARPHVWRWNDLYPLAARAGDLVPVGRGGERRAIALANPGLGGTPYATPTLWAAIQYLGARETAPEHRHSQNAFRFVVEGEGVWTVVNGDPVAMRRGDFLLTPGWNFHGHHNDTDEPMAWIDGLDIPFVHYADAGFFEFGTERVTDEATPDISRSERLWAHPGLRPLSGLDNTTNSPIAAYRWEHTDRALREQLLLEDEGHPATVPGPCSHAVFQPDHGRGRDAHHPRRVPPAPRRGRHGRPPRGRFQCVAGLRRHRQRAAQRRTQGPRQGRPVRCSVLG
jgi:gentisate 1,2-dioxygenase